MGWALWGYLAAAHVLPPVWRLALWHRQAKGKEDPARLGERFGRASAARPDGPLLWVHALGIGEAGAMLAVIRALRLERPDLSVVLTTNTRTGAEGLMRLGLPEGVLHQYAPLDTPAPVARFLDHWRPDALLLAELDLWPLMLHRLARRRVPVVMANARLTDRRHASRRRMKGLMRDLLALIGRKLVQDPLTRARLIELGAAPDSVVVAGLLKAAADPLPDRPDRPAVAAALGGRPVWLAAAIEAAELPAIIETHRKARAHLPDLLLIVAPRQPAQADGMAQALAAAFGHEPARRGAGGLPGAGDAAYLADTMGEMGLWYRLAPVSFIGHSLPAPDTRLTGKNPFEAAALGSVVLHGPCTSNFAESYDALAAAGGACRVAGADDLAAQIVALLQDPARCQAIATAAGGVLEQGHAALSQSVAALREFLPAPRLCDSVRNCAED